MKTLNKFGFLLPVLTAIFIVLSLWSVNATRTTLLDVAIPLTTAILSSLLLWGLAHLLPMLGRKSLPPPMLDNINIFACGFSRRLSALVRPNALGSDGYLNCGKFSPHHLLFEESNPGFDCFHADNQYCCRWGRHVPANGRGKSSRCAFTIFK